MLGGVCDNFTNLSKLWDKLKFHQSLQCWISLLQRFKMYPMRDIVKFVCSNTGSFFHICGVFKTTEDFNIWQIPFKNSMFDVLQNLHVKLSCEEFFILCYWLCVAVAIIGLTEAITEFVRVYSDAAYNPSTFWNRSYRHISTEHRRKARTIGSALNIASNMLMLYGFLNFRYFYIFPWIIANGIIIALELLYWISNALSSKIFKWTPFMSLVFLVFRQAIIVHVMFVISALTKNWRRLKKIE